MNLTDYYAFVRKTTRYKDAPKEEQINIALYGLVGEIGSLISTIKKQLITEARSEVWSDDDIFEEIGDIIWYACSLLSLVTNKRYDILRSDLEHLIDEISSDTKKSIRIQTTLTSAPDFLKNATLALKNGTVSFNQYQALAYQTARTKDRTLLTVCASVLTQLGAELLRKKLPELELNINENLVDRETEVIVGEIIWHLAAIASLCRKPLEEIVKGNVSKVSFREDRGKPTQLHDAYSNKGERFPRKMAIVFLTIGKGVSQMYFKGKPIGDPLTDNNREDDGYRFHDVMHIANAAHLGWSPVLRKMLARKRKQEIQTDEVEDGARGQLEEEVIVKLIHSEGKRAARSRPPNQRQEGPERLFVSEEEISFNFLKTLRSYTEYLEPKANKDWEWVSTILEGYDVFHRLRLEEQGTVTADLHSRRLTFNPHVFEQIDGQLITQGAATREFQNYNEGTCLKHLTKREVDHLKGNGRFTPSQVSACLACKTAILECLDVKSRSQKNHQLIEIFPDRLRGQYSSKVSGKLRDKMWQTGIATFRLKVSVSQKRVYCLSAAVSGPAKEGK